MKVQITKQSFFDLVNRADQENEPYSFVRTAPVNRATADRHIELVSSELKLTALVSLELIEPRFFLEVE